MYYNETDEEKAERIGCKINEFIDKQLNHESYNGICLEVLITRVLFHLLRIYIKGWGDDPRKEIYSTINRKFKSIKSWQQAKSTKSRSTSKRSKEASA